MTVSLASLCLTCLPAAYIRSVLCEHAAADLLPVEPVSCLLQNIVGLIPLALILGEITEDLALRFGDVVGGLLNATFG